MAWIPPEVQADRDAAAKALVSQYEPGHENDVGVGGVPYPKGFAGGSAKIDLSGPNASSGWTPPSDDFVQKNASWSPPDSDKEEESPWMRTPGMTYLKNFLDKNIEQPLQTIKEQEKTQGYLQPRIEAAGGALKGLGEAAGQTLGAIKGAMISAALPPQANFQPTDVMKMADQGGQAVNQAVQTLPQGLQQTLNTPSAQAGNTMLGAPMAPLSDLQQILTEHSMPQGAALVGAGTLIGGAALMGKGGKPKVVEVKPPELKPAESAAADLLKPDLSKATQGELFDKEEPLSQPIPEAGSPTPAGVPDEAGTRQRDLFDTTNILKNDLAERSVKYQQEDAAWEQHRQEQEAQNAYDSLANSPLDENYQPSQQSSIIEKGPTKPIKSPGNRQGGAVDLSMFTDAAIDVAKKLGEIMEMTPIQFQRLATNRELGETDYGRADKVIAHLQAGGQLDAVPKLVLEKIGDYWTVVDHDGRHRADAALSEGKNFAASIQDEGGGFFKDNPEVIRNQNMDVVPNPFYKPAVARGFEVGNRVRLANGRIGLIIDRQGDSYRVKTSEGYEQTNISGILHQTLGGPGKKQGGAIDFSALFGKEEPTKSDMDMGARQYKELVRGYLMNSGTKEEFLSKLSNFQEGTNYQANIVARGPEFWNNRNAILAQHEPSIYSEQSLSTRQQTADLRPWEVFKREEMKTDKNGNYVPIPKGEDINAAGRFFNVAAIAAQANKGKLGGMIMKNFISRGQEILNQGTKLYKHMAADIDNFASIGREGQKNIVRTWTKYDGVLNDELVKRNLQWPTADMLVADGLNPKEIRVYQQLTKAMDKSYGVIEQVFSILGKDPPPRIPGYFPHFWTGAYKVLVKDINTGEPVRLEAFGTRRGANNYVKSLDPKMATWELQEPDAEIHANNIVSTWQMALNVGETRRNGIMQAMTNMLINADAASKRGIIKDVLERKANITGHEASKGVGDSFTDFHHNTQLIAAFQKHLESVSNFSTATNLVNELGRQFHEEWSKGMFKDTPNLKDALNEYIARASGNPVNHFAVIDTTLRKAAIYMGLSPSFFHTIGHSLSGVLSFTKLIWPNVNFWMSNIFQPLTNLGTMAIPHMERVLNGDKPGDLAGALNSFWRESFATPGKQGEMSKDAREALEWFRENNVISVWNAPHIDPMASASAYAKTKAAIFGKPNEIIENRGRAVTALQYYYYFRTVMPKYEALQAAKQRVATIMGEYDHPNSAGMYTDYGITGQSLRPFGILRNVYYGNFFQGSTMLFKAIGEGMKDPAKAPDIAKAAVPILAMQATYLMAAGASGMIGAKEWDYFAKVWNAHMDNWTLPMSQEMMRWGINKAKAAGANISQTMSQAMIYGALGTSLGFNIGPSVAAPAMNELGGIPAVSAAEDFLKIMKQVVDEVSGRGVNMEDLKGAVEGLIPPNGLALIDSYFQKGNTVPKSNSLSGGTYRTGSGITPKNYSSGGYPPQEDWRPSEFLTYAITGRRSITETDRTDQNNLYKMENEQDSRWRKETVERIVDSMMKDNPTDAITGNQGQETARLFKNAIAEKRGFDETNLKEDIEKEMKSRILQQRIKDLQDIEDDKGNPALQGLKLQHMQKLKTQ